MSNAKSSLAVVLRKLVGTRGVGSTVVGSAAVAMLLGMNTAAHAAIIYSGPLAVVVPATNPGTYVNLATATFAASAAGAPGWNVELYGGSSGLNFNFITGSGTNMGVLTAPGNFNSPYTVLPAGAVVGSADLFGVGNSAAQMASFRAGTVGGYLGLEFQNSVTGAVDFGWMQFTTTAGTGAGSGFPATLLGYAFDNTGASIQAGQTVVPEPCSAAVLAAGVGALSMRRARRQGKTA